MEFDHLFEGAICAQFDDWHFEDIMLFEGFRMLVAIFKGELDSLIDCLDSFVFDEEQGVLLILALDLDHEGVLIDV